MKSTPRNKLIGVVAGICIFCSSHAAELDLNSANTSDQVNIRQNLDDVDITYIVSDKDKASFSSLDSNLISSREQCDTILAKFKLDSSKSLQTSNGLEIVLGDPNTGEHTKVSFVPSADKQLALNYAYSAKQADGEMLSMEQELKRLDSEQNVYLVMQKIDNNRMSITASNQWPDKNTEVAMSMYKTPMTSSYESIDFINHSKDLQVEDISFYNCEGKLPGQAYSASRNKNKESIYY